MVRGGRMTKRACKHADGGMCQQPITRSKDRAPSGTISTKRL